jgi:hypothetical protein
MESDTAIQPRSAIREVGYREVGYREGGAMAQISVIEDNSRRTWGWVSIVFGTVFGGFGATFAAVALWMTITSPNPVSPFMVLCGGLFGLVGAALAGSGIRNVWLRHLFGVPTLTIPGGASLCLGEVRVARFHRRGGRPRARQAPELSAELVCGERVTYRQGTKDHTVTKVVGRHGLSVTTDQIPDTVSGQVSVEIPLHAPPSLALSNNRIVWSVRVRVRAPGVPDDRSAFMVTVLPMVAPEMLR